MERGPLTKIQRVRQGAGRHPTMIRVTPFALIAFLSLDPAWLGAPATFWLYGLKTIVGLAALWFVRPLISELRWRFSPMACVAGVGVFVLWVGLDPWYPIWGRSDAGWNPHTTYGAGSGLAHFWIGMRLLGSAVVVPPIEELFYRSFLYRFWIGYPHRSVALSHFDLRAFAVTSLVFGAVHREWLAGVVCGAIYQALVLRRGDLGDAVAAHAITNALLGAWVVARGAWYFW